MSDFSWSEFWWKNITGPRVVVTKVSEALLDNHMVILSVPADIPWRHAMRGTIQTAFRDRLDISDIVIEPIDVVDDNPDNINPGRFILSRFASSTISRGYREKSKVSIQDYITAKNVIKNRIVWVKGLKGVAANQWIKFCRGFDARQVQDGLFVLEIQGEIRQADVKPLELIDFSDYVCNYDVQLFNSFVLDDQDKYPDAWKKYISSVAATICDTDAEVSAELLETIDFQRQSAIDGIKTIADSPEYARRGIEESSKHVLWYCRNNQIAELEHRLWSAQVQVLFPIIEMERVSLIEKWHDIIQNALDNHDITQYNETLRDAIDVELGSLCYMMKHRTGTGLYVLYIPDADERDWISFLHDCRNQLAHASCCTTNQVIRLLWRVSKKSTTGSGTCP